MFSGKIYQIIDVKIVNLTMFVYILNPVDDISGSIDRQTTVAVDQDDCVVWSIKISFLSDEQPNDDKSTWQ